MRYLALPVAVLLFCLNPVSPAIAGPAAPPVIEPTDEWPFADASPNWETGWALVGKAIKGDKDALKKVRAARLTYAPMCMGRPDGHVLGNELLNRDLDWVRAMQRWEVLLMRTDTAAVAKGYKELKPRFRDPAPQLCRAVLHAWRCGDPQAMAALEKLDPDSVWVQAALAWTGERFPERESITKLIAIIPRTIECGQFFMMLDTHQLVPEESRPAPTDMSAVKIATLDLLGSTDSIRELETTPKEFKDGGLTERIGAFAADLGDAEAIEKVRQEFEAALPTKGNNQPTLDTFALNANIELADFSKVDRAFLIAAAGRAKGTSLIAYSLYALTPAQESEKIHATIVAFAGMPRRTMSQRALLARALDSGDAKFVRLAARAILALDGDSLDAHRNILRAFYRSAAMPELRKAFQLALRESGNEELKKLADIVKDDKWDVLNPRDRRGLTLTDAQKAALLRPFSNEEERKFHGGEMGVYWLNRAVFAEGQRAVVAAGRFYIEAIAAAGKPGKSITPNVYEYLMFRLRDLDELTRPAHDAMLKSRGDDFAAAILELETKFADKASGVESNAAMKAWRGSYQEDHDLEKSVAEELENHPERWGGAGLAAVARDALKARDAARFASLNERAQQISPLDFDVHYRALPRNERISTSTQVNWEAVSRYSWRLSLLHPTSPQAAAYNVCLAVRSGQPGWSINATLQLSQTRPPYKLWGETDFEVTGFAMFARLPNWRNLLRLSVVSWDAMDAKSRKLMRETWEIAGFMAHSYDILDNSLYAGGPSFEFTMNLANTMMATYDMEDVSILLDIARHLGRVDPAKAIELVTKADENGVSRYGRFVGTQTWVQAHGRLGTLDKEWARYDDMRGGKVGYPEYLDSYMLAGITGGNQYRLLETATEKISGYAGTDYHKYVNFYWRRAHMAMGKHAELGELPCGDEMPEFPYQYAPEHSALFHEARALLDAGKFAELEARTAPLLDDGKVHAVGEYADAAILRALAWKEQRDEKKKPLACVPETLIGLLPERERVLDCLLLEVLAGKNPAKELPAQDAGHYWHGSRWCERVSAFMGEGIISPKEVQARDPFMRGVLAYLQDDAATARTQLKACMNLDQRCSHEYHVAEWLLGNRLKEK